VSLIERYHALRYDVRADAGHDYATIEDTGFPRRVVGSSTGPVMVPASGEAVD
jgi:hypothetical protein